MGISVILLLESMPNIQKRLTFTQHSYADVILLGVFASWVILLLRDSITGFTLLFIVIYTGI